MSKYKTYNATPEGRRRKKVQKELHWLLVHDGHMSLFPPIHRAPEHARKHAVHKARVVQQSLEFGFLVPKILLDEVYPPPDPNPKVPPSDPNEAPF